MSTACGLSFDGSRFWVTHRRREYGPFDYQWSADLRGLELTYQGQKFGEHCSEDEIFADLKEYQLPQTVVEVACIALGSLLYGIINSLDEGERRKFLVDRLREHGHEKFADSCRENQLKSKKVKGKR